MPSHTAAWITAFAVLTGAACAGSGRNQSTGAAPIDTVHIRTADTMPPANGAGAMRSDTATHDSAGRAVPGAAQQDSTSGMSGVGPIDTTRQDSVKRSGADSVP
ncbi:MAG TPA: hypothetical protein VFN08_16110 [Gemmatimonadales bacterium]|nr:hypothetical protein [Gemmatimonadales bacterium]